MLFSLLKVKQAQITFNLFYFSRHRVPFIQDEGRGCMRCKVVVWILLSIFFISFYNRSVYVYTHLKTTFCGLIAI